MPSVEYLPVIRTTGNGAIGMGATGVLVAGGIVGAGTGAGSDGAVGGSGGGGGAVPGDTVTSLDVLLTLPLSFYTCSVTV